MLTHNLFSKIALSLTLLFNITACVTTQAPKISHIHVGHAMTAWKDTPNEEGLFIIAEKEALIAFEHAQYALESIHDLKLTKMHIRHVQHAMNPKLPKNYNETGPGLGYGFIKAINSSTDHILFAAESKDASQNIKQSAKILQTNVAVIFERNDAIVTISQAALQSSSHEEVLILTEEIKMLTEQNLKGYDANSDGIIGNANDEFGIKQLKNNIKNMIAKEDPPYQTVEKKYLFGLIRLPSGEWALSQSNNTNSHSSGFQY